MITFDYDKKTNKFHSHVFGQLNQLHLDILNKFVPDKCIELDILLNIKDVGEDGSKRNDIWSDLYTTYYELKEWNFLEEYHDQFDKKQKIRPTSLGKLILKKIGNQQVEKSVDITPPV